MAGTVQDSLMDMILYTMHHIPVVRNCSFGFENIILSVELDVMSIYLFYPLSVAMFSQYQL